MFSRYLVDHIAMIHDNQALVCDMCGLSFVNKSALGRHIRKDHSEHEFKCERCEFQTPLKRSYFSDL